jgi:hypothetical protein
MRVRRTDSFTQSAQDVEHSVIEKSTHKEILIGSTQKRIEMSATKPPFMHQTGWQVQKTMLESTTSSEMQESSMKSSKMGTVLRSRIKSIIKMGDKAKLCEICDEEMSKEKHDSELQMTSCEHSANYC